MLYFAPRGEGGKRRGPMPLVLFPWFFFWWSLAPDLRFSLGQTNTSCRRSVNISIIFSRLASIRQNLHEKRCRNHSNYLNQMYFHIFYIPALPTGHYNIVHNALGQRSEIRCCLYFRWLLDASQIKQ